MPRLRLDAFTAVILVLIVTCAVLLGIEGFGRLHRAPASAPAARQEAGTAAAPTGSEPAPERYIPPSQGGVG